MSRYKYGMAVAVYHDNEIRFGIITEIVERTGRDGTITEYRIQMPELKLEYSELITETDEVRIFDMGRYGMAEWIQGSPGFLAAIASQKAIEEQQEQEAERLRQQALLHAKPAPTMAEVTPRVADLEDVPL